MIMDLLNFKNISNMTEKDIKLVEEASHLEWSSSRIHEIENECESEEAKEQVHRMIVDGYRKEEYRCGCL